MKNVELIVGDVKIPAKLDEKNIITISWEDIYRKINLVLINCNRDDSGNAILDVKDLLGIIRTAKRDLKPEIVDPEHPCSCPPNCKNKESGICCSLEI